jgi:hypothetical protein
MRLTPGSYAMDESSVSVEDGEPQMRRVISGRSGARQ